MREEMYVSRFWLADGAPLDFSDRGFIHDPTGKWASAWAPNVKSYAEMDDVPCLVLIGEPGLGKTTALEQAAEHVRANPDDPADEVLFVDLSATTEESTLRSRLFGSAEWNR